MTRNRKTKPCLTASNEHRASANRSGRNFAPTPVDFSFNLALQIFVPPLVIPSIIVVTLGILVFNVTSAARFGNISKQEDHLNSTAPIGLTINTLQPSPMPTVFPNKISSLSLLDDGIELLGYHKVVGYDGYMPVESACA